MDGQRPVGIDIWEPYLRERFQREHLAYLLDTALDLGIPRATVYTQLSHADNGDDDIGPGTLGQLESMQPPSRTPVWSWTFTPLTFIDADGS